MFKKDSHKLFCLAVSILGLVLVGLGIYLLATSYSLSFITIGTIVSGIALLIVCGLTKCARVPCLLCLVLTLVALFLIIAGILAIIFIFSLVIGLILISLGVLTVLLTSVCLNLNSNSMTFIRKDFCDD